MASHALTTIDNPHDPFTDYDEWYAWDLREHNGNTVALLARVVVYSDELSEADQDIAVMDAIDEIIREDPELIYRKLSREYAEM